MKVSFEELIKIINDSNTKIQISRIFLTFDKIKNDIAVTNRRLKFTHINYIYSGKVEGTVNGIPAVVNKGDFFILSPNTPHSLTWTKNTVFYSLSFYITHNKEPIELDENFIKVYIGTEALEMYRNFNLTTYEHLEFTNIKLRNYLSLLLIDAYDQYVAQSKAFNTLLPSQRRKIVDYCEKQEYNNITPTLIAKHLGYNTDYFSRLFKNTYNISCKEWIFQSKINYAISILNTQNISLDELADKLGYSDKYVLARQFKKLTGVTPNKYFKLTK